MSTNVYTVPTIQHATPAARPTFRRLRGEVDYPAMLAVLHGSKEVDHIERTDTLDDITRNYQHLVNCDPLKDVILAEVEGRVVGYTRVWWEQEDGGLQKYVHISFLLPEWRGKGIRRALLRRAEQRLRDIAATRPAGGPRVIESFCSDREEHLESMLVGAGYEVARHGLQMVRPDLENIPDLPLPEGLVVRPVQPEHIAAILEASKEAFRDHWGFSEDAWDQDTEQFKALPVFQPHLWVVAWDGDQVAGQIQNFIDETENREYNRKRGYTEGISVGRPWRRRGLAHALIARSFQVHKDLGMTEAALGCDAENLSGAVRVYTDMGFRTVKRFTTYRKPLDANAQIS